MAYRVMTGFDVQTKADPTRFRRIEPGTVLEEDDVDCAEHFGWMLDDGIIVQHDPSTEPAPEPEPEPEPEVAEATVQDQPATTEADAEGA